MKITLNAAEQKLAAYLGTMRDRHSRDLFGAKSQRADASRTDLDINIEGVAAEIAWCRMNGVYPDTDTDKRPDASDAVTKDGYRVDVKTTKYEHGKMLITITKTGEGVDYYCLMIGTFPTYRLAGYIKASDAIQPENIDNNMPKPCYAIPQSRLTETIQ